MEEGWGKLPDGWGDAIPTFDPSEKPIATRAASGKVLNAIVPKLPELVGGAGVYTAAPGHGPFIHIDTRGYRARWSGTSGG